MAQMPFNKQLESEHTEGVDNIADSDQPLESEGVDEITYTDQSLESEVGGGDMS